MTEAERIRDKIAASKAKGLWMGGAVPYGFNQNGRTLDIREDEAANVRWIFEQVAGGISMVELAEQCATRGIKTRVRERARGRGLAACLLTRASLSAGVQSHLHR